MGNCLHNMIRHFTEELFLGTDSTPNGELPGAQMLTLTLTWVLSTFEYFESSTTHSLIGGWWGLKLSWTCTVPVYTTSIQWPMLSTLISLSLAVVGLHVFGVVRAWAGVDFINPTLGGGSMLNNGKFKFYLRLYARLTSLRYFFKSW